MASHQQAVAEFRHPSAPDPSWLRVRGSTQVKIVVALASLCFVVAGCGSARVVHQDRYWQRLPSPSEKLRIGINSIGVDTSGGLWFTSRNDLYLWEPDIRHWRKYELPYESKHIRLFGGMRTGLFADVKASDFRHHVLRLNNRTHSQITSYEHKRSGPHFKSYVSRNGHVLTWGDGRLHSFTGQRWVDHGIAMTRDTVRVIDAGDLVGLIQGDRLVTYDRWNRVRSTTLDSTFASRIHRAAGLANDKAIILDYSCRQVLILDLISGQLLPASRVNASLHGWTPNEVATLDDGSVLLSAYNIAQTGKVLFRIMGDGTVTEMPETIGIRWSHILTGIGPRMVSTDTQGAIWFAGKDYGPIALVDGHVQQHDDRIDACPEHCHTIEIGRDGAIYAASWTDIYSYDSRNSTAIERAPNADQPIPRGSAIWSRPAPPFNPLERAWLIDKNILTHSMFAGADGMTNVDALDIENGETRFSLPLVGDMPMYPFVARLSDDKWVATSSGHIHFLNTDSGELTTAFPFERDPRIDPVAVDGDIIVVERFQGRSLARLSPTGARVWTADLPGMVVRHMSLVGSALVVQTISKSFPRVLTTAFNINTGQELWVNNDGAGGGGMATCDATQLFIEARTYDGTTSAYDATSGRLIWRNSGIKARVSNAPIVDSSCDGVFVVDDDGVVARLSIDDGSTLWQTELNRRPVKPPYEQVYPYQSFVTLQDAYLMVLTDDQVLTFLNPQTGHPLGRIEVTHDVIDHGKNQGPSPLLSAPWLIGDKILVATKSGVSLYEWPEFALRGE